MRKHAQVQHATVGGPPNTSSYSTNDRATSTFSYSKLRLHVFTTLRPSLGNVVGIAVGVTVGVIVLFVVLTIIIIICVVGCYKAHTSSGHSRKTVTTTTQPATVTTTSLQGGSQTYLTPGTDVKQATTHEMYACRSPPKVACASTPRYSPPPYQPPTTTSHAPISTTVNKTSSQQGASKDAGKDVNLAPEHKTSTLSSTPEAALLFCN